MFLRRWWAVAVAVGRAGGAAAAVVAARNIRLHLVAALCTLSLYVCVRVFVCVALMAPLHVCQARCATPPDLRLPLPLPPPSQGTTVNIFFLL